MNHDMLLSMMHPLAKLDIGEATELPPIRLLELFLIVICEVTEKATMLERNV